MIATFLAATLVAPAVHLEAKLPKDTFQRGEKVRIEVFAVNDSDQEAVIGISALGNYASGNMESEVAFTGDLKPVLNYQNPNRAQIMIDETLHVQERDFAVIPPKGRKLVFYEQIEGEWKDGYTPWDSAPEGIQAISIPARPGEYKYSFAYTFNRMQANKDLKKAATGTWLNKGNRRIVFDGNAQKLLNSAVQGKWSVSGSFRIAG